MDRKNTGGKVQCNKKRGTWLIDRDRNLFCQKYG